MQNQLTNFDFNSNTIRVVELDGNPWFVAKDVTDVLSVVNTSQATANLCQTEVRQLRLNGGRYGRPSKLISESGLYKLIMRSDKPEARAFQDWVTQVVLPSIRKDGGYIAGEEKFAAGEMSEDELILKAQQILQRKVERLSKQNEAMRQELSAVTVAEYVALNHVYFQHSEKTRLAHRASLLAAQRDICIHKQPRLIRTKGREIETQVNVYPRDLLDEAAMSLNLFEAARGTPRPLH